MSPSFLWLKLRVHWIFKKNKIVELLENELGPNSKKCKSVIILESGVRERKFLLTSSIIWLMYILYIIVLFVVQPRQENLREGAKKRKIFVHN